MGGALKAGKGKVQKKVEAKEKTAASEKTNKKNKEKTFLRTLGDCIKKDTEAKVGADIKNAEKLLQRGKEKPLLRAIEASIQKGAEAKVNFDIGRSEEIVREGFGAIPGFNIAAATAKEYLDKLEAVIMALGEGLTTGANTAGHHGEEEAESWQVTAMLNYESNLRRPGEILLGAGKEAVSPDWGIEESVFGGGSSRGGGAGRKPEGNGQREGYPHLYDVNGNYTGGRTKEELDALANDPAHAGSKRQIDIDKGIHEREVGLGVEESGKIKGPIIRDPSGEAEFFDADGQAWDVKSFNSNYKPKKGGYTLQNSMDTIYDSLDKNENVILDTTNLSEAHKVQLLKEISEKGLTDHIIVWP